MKQIHKFMLVILAMGLGAPVNLHGTTLKMISSRNLIASGQSLIIDIVTDDPTGINGAVMSLSFPEDVLALDDPPVTTGFFQDGGWQVNTDMAGVVSLSGLIMGPLPESSASQKGAQYTPLFSVHFSGKSDARNGTYRITLRNTDLCNGPAGWGKDINNNGIHDQGDKYEQAPLLYTVGYPSDSGDDVPVTDILMASFARYIQIPFKLKNMGNGSIQLSTAISASDVSGSVNNSQNPSVPAVAPIMVLKNPVDNQSAVSLTPALEVSLNSTEAQGRMLWQISRDAGFEDLVYQAVTSSDHMAVQVPELVLDPQSTYYWRVNGSGGSGLPDPWSSPAIFTTGSADDTDSDKNGIPDNQEIASDGNRILREFPDINVASLKLVQSDTGAFQFGVYPGPGASAVDNAQWMGSQDLAVPDAKQIVYPSGLLALKLHTDIDGAAATVTIYCSSPVKSKSVWRGYDPGSGNYDAADYATIARDRQSVLLKLTDGGAGDADGAANGVIVSIGGMSAAR